MKFDKNFLFFLNFFFFSIEIKMLKRALLNNIHIYDACGMDYVLKLF